MTGQTRICLYFSTVLVCWIESVAADSVGTTVVCHSTQYCQSHAITLLTSQCRTFLPIDSPINIAVRGLPVSSVIYLHTGSCTPRFCETVGNVVVTFLLCFCSGWCNDMVKSICGDSYRPVTVRYMRSREGRDLDIPTGLSEFKSLL
jgi:hypothetical protein